MISFRRHYLDQVLFKIPFQGDVIDIGGEREESRGSFCPPLDSVKSWKYLNSNPKTAPDYLASADNIPVDKSYFDIVKITEVLEHVSNPERVLAECFRVLKPGGEIIASVPFLYSVHGDPDDYQRWTPSGLKKIFLDAGFRDLEISPMGGLIAVCCDAFEHYCHLQYKRDGRLKFFTRVLRIGIRRIFLGILLKIDSNFPDKWEITTGYFIKAKR